jgi:phosphoesterase RecJ-like protein
MSEIKNERLEIFSQKLKERVTDAKRIVLFQHKRPDLDSIGSNIGFLNYIEHFNPQVQTFILSTDRPSKNMFEKINNTVPEHFIITDPSQFEFKNEDLLVLIDFSEISRATKFPEFELKNPQNVFVLDHHLVVPKYENSYIEANNQSASSIIFELLELENIEIKKINYEFIIMGILGDSGFLRYRDNKFTQTLGIINKYVQKFGSESYYQIIEGLEENRSIEEYQIQKIYLNNLTYKESYAFTTLTNQEREEAGVPANFTDSVNGAILIRNLEKTKFVFSVTQDLTFPDRFNISFRTCSNSDFIVRDLAAKIGGGGHAFASGAQVIASNMKSAVNLITSAIDEFTRI